MNPYKTNRMLAYAAIIFFEIGVLYTFRNFSDSYMSGVWAMIMVFGTLSLIRGK